MFTTCPACRSNLAVSAADLRVGQGYVRCGRCDRVFNALMTLSDDLEEDDQSGLAATGTTTMPTLDDPGEDMPEDLAEELAAELAEPAVDASAMAAAPAAPDYQVDVVESQATGTFETIVLEGDGYLQTEEHVDEGVVDATLKELTRQIDDNAAKVEEHPDQEIVLETAGETEEEFDADAAVGNRRRHHWVWWMAALLLGLALGALLLHHNRQTLVAQPALERAVKTFYGWFGATVEPHWDVKAYDVRRLSGDVLMGTDNGFTVQASIRNHATVAQPPPVIRVTLKDQYGNKLINVDIKPGQYLLNAAPSRMAPDQRFDTSFRVVDSTGQAAGFELDACLPAAGGQLQCSTDR